MDNQTILIEIGFCQGVVPIGIEMREGLGVLIMSWTNNIMKFVLVHDCVILI